MKFFKILFEASHNSIFRILLIISALCGLLGMYVFKHHKKKFIGIQIIFFFAAGWYSYKNYFKIAIKNSPSIIDTSKYKEKTYLLINVLGKEEFDDCHIKTSIHIPFERIELFLDTLKKDNFDLSKPIIFYCSNYFCTASDEAARIATQKKFLNVSVYKGGTAEWYQKSKTNSGFEFVGEAIKPYLNMIILKRDYENNEPFSIITAEELQKIINI